MTSRSLYEAFDKAHDQHNLGLRAETDPAVRDLLRITHDALAALARAEGVSPFSLLPALAASIKPKADQAIQGVLP